jgi:hypothetical protein
MYALRSFLVCSSDPSSGETKEVDIIYAENWHDAEATLLATKESDFEYIDTEVEVIDEKQTEKSSVFFYRPIESKERRTIH